MSAFTRRSGDIGYYNGPTPDISGFENVFVCTIRCNQGGIDRTTYADQQTGWVSSHLGFSSQYVFNGNVDAYSVGVLFGQQGLPGFVLGKSGILVDCEDEGATNTHAWGPVQANAFITGVRSVRPDIPVSAFFIYHNYTVNRRFNWQGCADAGMGLVYARPGAPGVDDYLYWPANFDRYIKQDGTVNGVDADWHNTAWVQIIGTPKPARRSNDMPIAVGYQVGGGSLFWKFLIEAGRIKNTPDDQADVYASVAGISVVNVNNADMRKLIWDLCPDFLAGGIDVDTPLTALAGGLEWIAPWRRAGTVQLTDEQTATLGKSVADTVISALPASGATPEQVEAAVKTALDALTLKAA